MEAGSLVANCSCHAWAWHYMAGSYATTALPGVLIYTGTIIDTIIAVLSYRAVATGTVGPVSTGPQPSGFLVPRPKEGSENETNSHARVQLCQRIRLFRVCLTSPITPRTKKRLENPASDVRRLQKCRVASVIPSYIVPALRAGVEFPSRTHPKIFARRYGAFSPL